MSRCHPADRERMTRATAGGEVVVADGQLDVLARDLAEAVPCMRQRLASCPCGHRKGAGCCQCGSAAD